MKLYIGNCSKQVINFTYRSPDQDKIIEQTIPIGAQVQVYKDTDSAALDYIIAQHILYGLTKVSDIDRTKAFIGACYQFDKPIDVEKIVIASTHNDDALALAGHEYRKQAAVALNDQLNQNTGGKVSGVSVEIEEQGRADSNRDDLMVEEIEVGTSKRGRGRPRKE